MKKVVVVTGAGRGIGMGIAAVLAEAGWHVVVNDIHVASAEETAKRVGGTPIIFDVADCDAVERGAAEILEKVGPVYALVNNAGWDRVLPFAETDRHLWRKLIDINLMGTIAVTHALLPSIRESAGRIVNIASVAAKTGARNEVVYSATKGGVLAFTYGLARELARDKVTVNAVCPGATDSTLNAQYRVEHAPDMDRIRRGTLLAKPYGRIGRPEDIGYAVEYLLSPRGEWVTGQEISVDGGLHVGG